MYKTVEDVEIDTKHEIRFYRETDVPYGIFSNFSPHPITINGLEYPTTEHYFQVQPPARISSGNLQLFAILLRI
jgi:predicted NAD-dependent protein-ADP-ribosyltransferase YbiA (DUF1768 family)